MSRRKGQFYLALGLFIWGTFATDGAEAQFNPGGRKRPKLSTNPGRTVKTRRPAKAKQPNRDALIARYTAIVLAQPASPFPLQRLAELYRKRDGNLDKLIAAFVARSEGNQGAGDVQSRNNALIVLAGIYKQDGQVQEAVEAYRRALKTDPRNAASSTALARLLKERGDKQGARGLFLEALKYVKVRTEREQLLRELSQLCLDLQDFDCAGQQHSRLVKLSRGSFFVKGELARELMLRGHYARAVTEYEKVVTAAQGDNRVLAPALRDYGKALAKAGKREQAEKTLKRALRLAGRSAGVRREIFEAIADLYRESNNIRQLVQMLEKDRVRDFERLKLLGKLYEETGRLSEALATYKLALKKKRKALDVRIRAVKLLHIQGQLGEAIVQYRQLIRAAPHETQFVFELSDALLQQGDRNEALKELGRLERQAALDADALATLVDYYEKVGESERATALLKRLAGSGTRDARHVIELGDRYYRAGKKQLALKTWKRVHTLIADRARAHSTLGEVYLNHDMPKLALAALRKAVELKPKQRRYRRGLALALERSGAAASNRSQRLGFYAKAIAVWSKLLESAGDNEHAARESRQHMVTLWRLSNELDKRLPALLRQLDRNPPNLRAGRLLAEGQIRMRHYAEAEKTLRRIVKVAPGDSSSLLQLERVLVQQRKFSQALDTLKLLIRSDRNRAREYYQRMARYAAELYLDDDALAFAAKAVELNPDDANGHRKLGEMYQRRQQPTKAIDAYRKALMRNDRLFTVNLKLAELLIAEGQLDQADALYRRAVRASPDEDLVLRAARASMQLNLGRGSLEVLERDLLPVALSNPQKPVYRRLLIEIYSAMAFPLIQQLNGPNQRGAETARQQLLGIGERAVKPLLDALTDENSGQQRIALSLLGYINNPGAGPALLSFATSTTDDDLRILALLAAGGLESQPLLGPLAKIAQPGARDTAYSDPVRVTAAWGAAKFSHRRAPQHLIRMLQSNVPGVRALAAIGLSKFPKGKHQKALLAVAQSHDAGQMPRAAAAYALGVINARESVDVLERLHHEGGSLLQQHTLISLSRLGAPSAAKLVASALLADDTALQRAAATAAVLLTSTNQLESKRYVPTSRVRVREQLASLIGMPAHRRVEIKALQQLSPHIIDSALSQVSSSPQLAARIARQLSTRHKEPHYGQLGRGPGKLADVERQRTTEVLNAIAEALVRPYAALVQHPDPEVRAVSVALLGTLENQPEAMAAMIAALADKDEGVQRAALRAVAKAKPQAAPAAIRSLIVGGARWPIRVLACQVLAQLPRERSSAAKQGETGAASQHGASFKLMTRLAQQDEYALVRQAAMEAMVAINPQGSAQLLEAIAAGDAESDLRQTADRLLKSLRQ